MLQKLDNEAFRFLTAALFCVHAPFATTIHAIIKGSSDSVANVLAAASKHVTTRSNQQSNHREC